MTDPNSETAKSPDSAQDLNKPIETLGLEHTQANKSEVSPMDADMSSEKAQLAPTMHYEESENAIVPDSTIKVPEKKQEAKRKVKKEKAEKSKARKEAVSPKFSKTQSRGFKLTPDGLLRHFLACRVCCYFLSGTQALYGRDVVDRLVNEFDGSWLYVPLTNEMRTLLHKTYGVKVDEGDFFVEHACEVCCRRFVIDLPEPKDFVENEDEDLPLEEPERKEPVIFEPPRTTEDRESDWERDRPMLLVEFKHKR